MDLRQLYAQARPQTPPSTQPHTSRALGRHWRRVLRSLSVGLLLTIQAGCAHFDQLHPGMSRAEVLQQAGRPSHEYVVTGMAVDATAAAATWQRMEYVGAWAQEAWLIDLDDTGVVRSVTAARTQNSFSQVRLDIDDLKAVRRKLGTPYRTERYALLRLTAWHYPYRDGPWGLEMSAMFDDAGILRRMESGPDPRFDRGGNRND